MPSPLPAPPAPGPPRRNDLVGFYVFVALVVLGVIALGVAFARL